MEIAKSVRLLVVSAHHFKNSIVVFCTMHSIQIVVMFVEISFGFMKIKI